MLACKVMGSEAALHAKHGHHDSKRRGAEIMDLCSVALSAPSGAATHAQGNGCSVSLIEVTGCISVAMQTAHSASISSHNMRMTKPARSVQGAQP